MMSIVSLQPEQEVSIRELMEITRQLNREGQLLDERRYSDWLTLLTEDIHYWAPLRFMRQQDGFSDDWDIEKELSQEGELHMSNTNYVDLQVRVARLNSGRAHTENPPWFTQRLITNIDARKTATEGEYEVTSKFLLNRFKGGFVKGREQTIVGSREDIWTRIGGALRLRSRRIIYNTDNYRWGSYVLM